MKIKNGKLSLGKNDTRMGNFVITKEAQHYKMQDINSYWSMRIAYMHPMYMLIEECLAAKNEAYLELITNTYYALGTICPDLQMIDQLHKAYNDQVERMRDKGVVSEKQDEEALQQVQQSYQTKEELKRIMDGKPEGDTQGQPV